MLPTASKLGLARLCLYPWAEGAVWPESTSPAASLGTVFHDVVAAVINDPFGQHVVPSEVARMRPEALAFEVLEQYPDAQAEVAFAYNYNENSTRCLGINIGRDYQLFEREFAGTADIVSVQGRLIRDWKTGRQENTTPCERNAQMHFLALCGFNSYGWKDCTIELAFVNEHGDVFIDRAFLQFDDGRIRSMKQDLRAIDVEIFSKPTPNPGRHCSEMFCPAIGCCPASRRSLEGTLPPSVAYPLAVAQARAIQGPEHVAWLLERLPMAEAAIEAAKAALREYVQTNGAVELPDGSVYREVSETRESVDASDLVRLAAACGLGESDLRKIVEWKVGKGELESLIRAGAPKGKGAQVTREAFAALRTEGLLRSKEITSCRLVKPKKTRAA